MASNSKSTQLTAPASSTQKYTLTSYFNELSTDNTGNYSSIYCSATLGASNISFESTDGGTLYIYWHDDRENYDRLVASSNISSCGMGYGSRSVGGTINVTHKEDGTLNGYAYAYFTKNKQVIYIPATGGVTTDWTALTSIQRKAIVTSATNFTDEENPTITFNNPVGYRINARLEFAGSSINRENIANTGSYTFELTTAERTLLRQKCTGKTMTVRQTIATCVSGTTESQWSWQDKQMSMTNATPTETSIETIDTNFDTTDLTGNNHTLVKYKSNARVITIFNTLKYATLSSLTINGIDVTSSAVAGTQVDGTTPYSLTYTINSFDGNSVKVIATDTRGYSLEIEDTPYIVDYFLVSANASFYRVQPTTGQIGVKFNGNYFNDSFGDENNTLTIRYKYKKTTDQDYSNYISLVENTDYTISNNTFYSGTSTSESQIILSTLFDYRYNYEIVFEFIDELSTSSTTATIQRGIPIMWWNKTKFQVNGDLYVADNDGSNATNILTYIDNKCKNEIATLSLSYETSVSEGYIPLSDINSNTTRLTYSNNGIKIGSGISKIKVSANVFGASTNNGSYLWTQIERVRGNTKTAISIAIDNTSTYFGSTSHTPALCDVQENDIIKVYKIDSNSTTIRTLANTYLTVEVVE